MKHLTAVAGAAFALAVQAAPLAAPAATVSLTSLGPARIGVASSAQSCEKAAALNGSPYFVKPTITEEQGISGIARIRIDLTQTGEVARESVLGSSGNHWLDEAALTSARMSRFTPESVNCKPVAGSYLYSVEF
jgi:TonB family protein